MNNSENRIPDDVYSLLKSSNDDINPSTILEALKTTTKFSQNLNDSDPEHASMDKSKHCFSKDQLISVIRNSICYVSNAGYTILRFMDKDLCVTHKKCVCHIKENYTLSFSSFYGIWYLVRCIKIAVRLLQTYTCSLFVAHVKSKHIELQLIYFQGFSIIYIMYYQTDSLTKHMIIV